MRKTTEKWKKIGTRAAAAVLSLALVVPMFNFLTTDADAVTSLSGIESLKSKGTFSILEIVPREGTGSIGYYVKDYEPTSSWKKDIASYVGEANRKDYVDKLFAALSEKYGLMGSAGADPTVYPLVQSGPYKEYLPWANDMPAEVTEVKLNHIEETTVPGIFQKDADGDYILNDSYVYDEDGDYVENALYYVYRQRAELTYYYHVDFERIVLSNDNAENYVGIPLYVPVTSGEHSYYEYAGTLEYDGEFRYDRTINETIGYYIGTVLANDHPVTTWEDPMEPITITPETVFVAGSTLYTLGDEGYESFQVPEGFVPVEGTVYYKEKENAHNYYAVTNSQNPYRLAKAEKNEVGSFKRIDGYRYVGNGNGGSGAEYYTLISGSTEQSVSYNTIFVTGGYTNSEWFERYVLDLEEARLGSYRVTVSSVTLDKVNPDMLKNYGLVVISAGFDWQDNGKLVPYTMDVNAATLEALRTMPRVVDTRITNAPNLLSARDGANSPTVTAANVYNFAVGIGEDARSALATNQFHTPFVTTTPYQVVLDEITYENGLRQLSGMGTDQMLPTEISMASCIRYIINTHRVQNKKTSLNVLDIEPMSKKYKSGDSGWLTAAMVKKWLPTATQNLIGDRINITHMSTSELVCNIEDMTEMYDLIYIGAESQAKNLPDGYYYANIGDTETVDAHLGGLLTDDGGPKATERTARYSGNDLTPRKMNELLEFAGANMPIVVSSKLTTNTAARPESQMRVAITHNSSGTLTATASFSPAISATPIYMWESSTSKNGPWETEPVFSNQINANIGKYYRCIARFVDDGAFYDAYSDTVYVNGTLKWDKNTTNLTHASGNNDLQNKITPNNDARTLKVSVEWAGSSVKKINSTSYKWYKNGTLVSSGQVSSGEIPVYTAGPENATYYCEITVNYQYKSSYSYSESTREGTYRSQEYQLVAANVTAPTQTPSTSTAVTIPGAPARTNVLDPAKMDPSSLLSEALTDVWARENVMVQSALERETAGNSLDNNQDALVKYLNLSRPSINVTDTPTPYSGNVNNAVDCAGELDFEFSIQNPTDPTPQQTRYECNLYIDQNGDGRHSADERIGDVYLGEVVGSNTKGVANGALMENVTYTLYKKLNREQFSGLVAWKLEVIKVGDSTAHASQKGYTYIAPPANKVTQIDVLQIMHTNGTSGVNLATDSLFEDLYDELAAANMYDINVTATNVNALNSNANVSGVLNNYDMIIIGFHDTFGEMDEETATAIVQYIESGRAILFTHDTTSYWNWDNSTASTASGLVSSSNPHWGYYFNQIIRDKVGLDRYGVTNETAQSYGVNSGGTIDSDEAKSLQRAGYTVAYEPGSAKVSADETQGYTNLIVDKYRKGSTSSTDNKYTETVSQTNRGQITEYPYRLGDNLTIAQTHAQYYQLNMNADDIVVWYCLGGSGSSGGYGGGGNYNYEGNNYNDGTNAYYIYNRGNITYSGAGHTNSFKDARSDPDQYERKLFVNTMVAAYRAAYSKPTIEFMTAGDTPASVHLLPVEYSGSGNASQSLEGEQTIYFKIADSNLTAEKKIAVELYYDAEGGAADATLTPPNEGAAVPVVKKATLGTIYRVDTGAVATADNMSSGILYRTTIPSEILSPFNADANKTKTQIYLKATTTIYGNSSTSTYTGSDFLVLEKLGLLRLE